MDQLTKEVRFNQWAELILEANNSGLTKAEFCRRHGLSKRTMYYYQTKIRKGLYNSIAETDRPSLVEVPVTKTVHMPSSVAAVIHAGDISIEISDGISESTLMSIGRMIRNAL